MAKSPGRWSPVEATKRINDCARRDDFGLCQSMSVISSLADFGLDSGDVLHLLKTGMVYDDPDTSTRDGYYKYSIEGPTPNSNGKSVSAVVIPDGCNQIKVAALENGIIVGRISHDAAFD